MQQPYLGRTGWEMKESREQRGGWRGCDHLMPLARHVLQLVALETCVDGRIHHVEQISKDPRGMRGCSTLGADERRYTVERELAAGGMR